MEPRSSTLHIDKALTDLSIAYFTEEGEFVTEQLFPPLAVRHRSDKYYIYGKENLLVVDTEIAHGTDVPVVEFTLSNDSYSCRKYKLRGKVDYDDADDTDEIINLEEDTALVVGEIFRRSDEFRLATRLVGSATEVTNGDDFAGLPSQWDTYRTDPTNDISDPLADIENAKETIMKATNGKMPNKLALGWAVWKSLKLHPDVLANVTWQASMGGTKSKVVTPEMFADLVGVDEVIVAKEFMINDLMSAVSTATPEFIWGKHALLAYVNPDNGPRKLTFGRSFNWKGRGGELAGASAGAPVVRKWEDEANERTFIELKMMADRKIVCNGAAYYFNNCVS